MVAPARTTGYTAIAGLGATGLACARHLCGRGERVAVVDSRSKPPGLAALRAECPQATVTVGRLDREILFAASRVVVSPGLDLRSGVLAELRSAGRPVVGEMSLFAAATADPVVAVTGSNGKSTVVTLLAAMAHHAGRAVAVGGNLGTPALDLLAAPSASAFVLEVSSFQLEACPGFRPQVAAVLNVTADHMDRYDDLEHYAATKARLLQDVEVAVVNADDPRVARMGEGARQRVAFSVAGAEVEYRRVQRAGNDYLAVGDELRLAVAESGWASAGRPQQANALAAMALADAMGLPVAAQCAAVRDFKGLPHRMERVGEWRGVEWINDSKATNVGAAVAALKGVDRPTVLIAGGQGKGADFRPLVEACVERTRALVLLGEDGDLIEAALAGRLPVVRVNDLEAAVGAAAGLAHAGDTVLLAPACASFDAFDGYAHRGSVFCQAVLKEVANG